MATQMNGMRGRTVARVNTARVNAARVGYAPGDIHSVDKKLYAWVQVRGPEAIETTPSSDWTPVLR